MHSVNDSATRDDSTLTLGGTALIVSAHRFDHAKEAPNAAPVWCPRRGSSSASETGALRLGIGRARSRAGMAHCRATRRAQSRTCGSCGMRVGNHGAGCRCNSWPGPGFVRQGRATRALDAAAKIGSSPAPCTSRSRCDIIGVTNNA